MKTAKLQLSVCSFVQRLVRNVLYVIGFSFTFTQTSTACLILDPQASLLHLITALVQLLCVSGTLS